MDNVQIKQTKVFLVEDSADIRSRLVELLAKVDGVVVTGEADNPTAAVSGILQTQPDFVVLDIQIIGGTGIEVLRDIHPRAANIVFIVLSNHLDPQYRHRYMSAGASYFFDKSTEFREIVNVIAGNRPAQIH